MAIRAGINLQACGESNEIAILNRFKPGVVLGIDIANQKEIDLVHSWGGLWIARRWFDGGDQWSRVANDPIEAANYCYGKLQELYGPVWGSVDGYVGFNEYVGHDKFVNISTDGDGNQYNFGDLFELYGMDENGDAPPGAPDYYIRDLTQNLRIARWAAHYECEMFNLFRLGKYPMPYGAWSMPRGNCEWWEWTLICFACNEILGRFPGDFLSSHNDYWQTKNGPLSRESFDPANEYLVGREFFFIGAGKHEVPMLHTVPWLYTEAGCDNGNKGGYKVVYPANQSAAYSQHIKDNVGQLVGLAEKYQQTLIGNCYFVAGRNQVWVKYGFDFSDDGQVADEIASFPKTHTVYGDSPEPPSPPTPEYTAGFADYALQHPEIGKAQSELFYDAFGNGLQITETGVLYWRNRTGYIGHWKVN